MTHAILHAPTNQRLRTKERFARVNDNIHLLFRDASQDCVIGDTNAGAGTPGMVRDGAAKRPLGAPEAIGPAEWMHADRNPGAGPGVVLLS